MSVRDLTVNARLLSGETIGLGRFIDRLKWEEGRTVRSRYELPSKLSAKLKITDNFITEGDEGAYSTDDIQGAFLTVQARGSGNTLLTAWEGYLSSVKFSDPDRGAERRLAIEAYELTEKLNNADQDIVDPTIEVTRLGNLEIPLAGIADSPRGMVASDELLVVVDDSAHKGFAWRESDSSRYAAGDFDLAGPNHDPVGICTDGQDTFWVPDSVDDQAYAYSSARKHQRDADNDLDFANEVVIIGWIPADLVGGTDAQIVYVSGNSLYLQDDSTLLGLDSDNGDPKSVLVAPYLDNGVGRKQVEVWDQTDKTLYQYRNITGSSPLWERDMAKDWSWGDAAPANRDNAFEALGRIMAVRNVGFIYGNRGSAIAVAYTVADPPVRDAVSDIDFFTAAPNTFSQNLYVGAAGGTEDNLYIATAAYFGGTLNRYNRLGETVVTALGQNIGWQGVWDRNDERFSGFPRGRRSLLAATGNERLYFNAASGSFYSAPPIGLIPSDPQVNIQDAASQPSGVTFPANSQYLRYAMSDGFVFVADLVADSSDSSGFKNVVSVYNHDGVMGPAVQLEIPGSDGAIVSMYWARDRLFVRLGAIAVSGANQWTVSNGVDPWRSYQPNFSTIHPWVLDSEEVISSASADIESVAFDGIYYRLLDTGTDTVTAYTDDALRVPAEDISLNSANDDPLAVAADGTYLYVADGSDQKVHVYRLSDGAYLPILNFTLANGTVRGMAYDTDNNRLHVGQQMGTHAYSLPATPPAPAYFADLNIGISAVPDPSGCASDGSTVFISSSSTNRIYAYDAATRQRVEDREIPPFPNSGSQYRGLTIQGGVLYALSASDNRIYAFDKDFRVRDSAKDFALFDISGTPQAVTAIGSRMYVAVDEAGVERVFVYQVDTIETINRPRETASQRWKALAETALGESLPAAPAGGRELPARDVGGSIREALRRCIDSELGRVEGSVLHLRGIWAENPSAMGPLDLASANAALTIVDNIEADGVEMVNPPKRERIEGLLANQVDMVDFQGLSFKDSSSDSVDKWGPKAATVPTDARRQDVTALADWFLDHWDEPYSVLDVKVNLLFESEVDSANAFFAKAHTPVTVSYQPTNAEGEDTNPWIVLKRFVDIKPVGAGELEIIIRFILISPRQFGIGWTLGGPEELQEDVLGQSTILVKSEY